MAISSETDRHRLDSLRKDIVGNMKSLGLKVTLETDLKTVDVFDMTLVHEYGVNMSLRKPDEMLSYMIMTSIRSVQEPGQGRN